MGRLHDDSVKELFDPKIILHRDGKSSLRHILAGFKGQLQNPQAKR